MKVYRVELCFSPLDEVSKKNYVSKNIGPYVYYRSEFSTLNGYKPFFCGGATVRQPSPAEDGLKHWNGASYAFASPFQFSMWFESDIWRLDEAGFKVFEYEVPDEYVECGYMQVQVQLYEAVLVNVHRTIDMVRMAERDPKYWDNVDAYFDYLEG